MKKRYIKPTVQVVKLQHQCQILVGSVRDVQDNLGKYDHFNYWDNGSDEIAR